MPKKTNQTKTRKTKRWTKQHKQVSHLLEEELHGLIRYIRALHRSAIILCALSTGLIIYALRVLFETEQHAVVGFLAIIATALLTIIFSLWSLKPWVLPRFLLPLDFSDIDLDTLINMFKDPREYLQMLKHHIQVLTESFLILKLARLRNAIIILTFGISVSILLSIALP